METIIENEPDFYLDEIQDQFIELTNDYFDMSTLWKRLVSDCGYSLQVTTDRAYQASEEERGKYLSCLEEILLDPNQLIYIDESNKDVKSSCRRRMWSRRGQSPFRNAYFAGTHANRYTLIAACDLDGFVLEACETVEQQRNSSDTDETRGTIDKNRFRIWVEEKLVPVLGNYKEGAPRSIVVMDNATIHGDIIDLIESAGARLVYTAPYSPDLNPIELMFGKYKSYLKRHYREPWWKSHIDGLASITPTMARSFYKHSRVPLCDHFESTETIEKRIKRLQLSYIVTMNAAAFVAIDTILYE